MILVESRLTIVAVDKGYTIEGGSLGPTLVTMNGRPADVGAGWVPTSASKLANTLIAFNLTHLDGQEATWLLALDCRYLASNVVQLPDDHKRTLLPAVKAWHQAVTLDFLTNSSFASRDDLSGYFAIAASLRNELLQLIGVPEPVAPDVVRIDEYQLLEIRTATGLQRVPVEHVRSCLETPLDKRFTSACRKGIMEWTSPIDGSVVTDVRGFALSHILMAWRCVDTRNKFVFFIIAAGFSSASLSLWIPAHNKIIVPEHLGQGQISVAGGTTYLAPVIRHLFELGRDLIPFLCRPTARMAHYTWPLPAVHVGHYHWNELPGLGKIVELLQPDFYPIIYDLGGASGSCFYERLINLYPEVRHVIDHSVTNLDQMSRHAYRCGIQPIKFAGCFVSADIRHRIQRTVSLHPAYEQARKLAASARGPIIVLGLRVENRTASNLVDFYVHLTERIAEQYGEVVILIDGHNVRADSRAEVFISNQEQRAVLKPIEVERDMVAALQDRLHDERITVVDCVGMTLRQNLAWLRIADFCVAPWGAGLAKYRWALNTPSYVLASRYCMRHKDDMNIYSSADFMQSPSRYQFIAEQLVEDQPNIPVLIDIGGNYQPYYANYHVDKEPAAEEAIGLLASILVEE